MNRTIQTWKLGMLLTFNKETKYLSQLWDHKKYG